MLYLCYKKIKKYVLFVFSLLLIFCFSSCESLLEEWGVVLKPEYRSNEISNDESSSMSGNLSSWEERSKKYDEMDKAHDEAFNEVLNIINLKNEKKGFWSYLSNSKLLNKFWSWGNGVPAIIICIVLFLTVYILIQVWWQKLKDKVWIRNEFKREERLEKLRDKYIGFSDKELLDYDFFNLSGKEIKKITAGEKFEKKCAKVLKNFGDKIIQGCYYLSNGKTSQIDIVFFHSVGIFVIECKDYQGKICGSDSDYNWSVFYDDKIYYFYNPIMQNESHIHFIKNVLDLSLEDVPIFNYVCFSDTAEINIDEIEQDDNLMYGLCQFSSLYEMIKTHISHFQKVLSNEQLDDIYNKLLAFTDNSEETKEVHRWYIESLKDSTD